MMTRSARRVTEEYRLSAGEIKQRQSPPGQTHGTQPFSASGLKARPCRVQVSGSPFFGCRTTLGGVATRRLLRGVISNRRFLCIGGWR
jgi:hypothetical protein